MAALLFDLDGTMLETDPLHAAVFREIFAERGREIDDGFYTRELHGRLNADIFGEHFPDEDASALADEKEARFRERLGSQAEPMPGLRALIGRAEQEGWPMAVVTNAPPENARAMLAAIGLDGRFDTIVLGDDCPRGKPDPYPYAEAMRRLGVRAERTVAFEDSRAGVTSASRAGAWTVGLRSSLDDAALRDAGARLTIRTYEDPDLDTALDTLKGAPAQ
ncbi:HAD family hydrolase [Histidinibacterium aquaticum]|uniref:HAD family phosphatase n=1 Tax=Histidinibacterium aquaticum TaxID=2613962 RepID=A0A5J5GN05_9RHOB|nr:HAD family phosphatase [Histidinibacterium aquaticum]KAA9009093.1 HAD family phosphatase [Histidinibacterium aquaticum]